MVAAEYAAVSRRDGRLNLTLYIIKQIMRKEDTMIPCVVLSAQKH